MSVLCESREIRHCFVFVLSYTITEQKPNHSNSGVSWDLEQEAAVLCCQHPHGLSMVQRPLESPASGPARGEVFFICSPSV